VLPVRAWFTGGSHRAINTGNDGQKMSVTIYHSEPRPPEAGKTVRWTVLSGASLASLEEGQAFLGSLALRQEKLNQRRELGRAAARQPAQWAEQ
jgi:hypothetical protein